MRGPKTRTPSRQGPEGSHCSKNPAMRMPVDCLCSSNYGWKIINRTLPYGVCGWWGHFNHGVFGSKGLLLWKGARLGTSTNNIAEAHGMASSLNICVRFYCWVIEQTSELAQHSMLQECEFKRGRTGM